MYLRQAQHRKLLMCKNSQRWLVLCLALQRLPSADDEETYLHQSLDADHKDGEL